MASIQTSNLKDRIKNDTFSSVSFTFADGIGDPIDLTDAAIRCQFRYRSKTGTPVKTIQSGSGITVTDAAGGVLEIDEFTPVDWAVDKYYYDIQINFSDGRIKTYVEGLVNVIQDVTTA